MGCARGVSGFGSNLGGSPRKAAGGIGKRLVRRVRDGRPVHQFRTRFRRSTIGLVVTANVEWRPEMNVADGDFGPLQASVLSATPIRKLSLGVFKMPLRRCLPEVAGYDGPCDVRGASLVASSG